MTHPVALTDDDVREILRLIDESDLEELRVVTEAFSLHVVREAPAKAGQAPAGVPPAEAEAAPRVARVERPAQDGLATITAPMIGTFYRAEAPGAEPYVAVGAHVEPNTVVCLIEVMKMMNPVVAGVAGTVVEVCAENAELVEYEAPLFHVRPDL